MTELSKEHEAQAIAKLQRLALERFDTRLGLFEAKEWLDELGASIGVHYYNQVLGRRQGENRYPRGDDRQRYLGFVEISRKRLRGILARSKKQR
jgi:uncharacterized protein (DUF2164 family)